MDGNPSDNRVPTPEISSMKPSSPTIDPAAHNSSRQSVEKETGDGTVYTKEIAYDGSNGQSDDGDSREKPGSGKDTAPAGVDEEAGTTTSATTRFMRRYRKYIRIGVHAVIWMLFTG